MESHPACKDKKQEMRPSRMGGAPVLHPQRAAGCGTQRAWWQGAGESGVRQQGCPSSCHDLDTAETWTA